MRVKLKTRCRDRAELGCRLSGDKIYTVLGIESQYYRLIDEEAEPHLYPSEMFDLVDPVEPTQWVREYEDGEVFAYPPPLNRPGFFEDYHDGDQDTIREFWQYISRNQRV